MTHRQEAVRDVARGRDIAARWCALAEQRLEHLSEMFETGRWRRYHSELAFLENIQEAKRAVQTWRALATGSDVAAAAATSRPYSAGRRRPCPACFRATSRPRPCSRRPSTSPRRPPSRSGSRPSRRSLQNHRSPARAASDACYGGIVHCARRCRAAQGSRCAGPLAPAVRSPVAAPAAMAAFTTPAEGGVRPTAVKAPPATPAVMATLLPQFARPPPKLSPLPSASSNSPSASTACKRSTRC